MVIQFNNKEICCFRLVQQRKVPALSYGQLVQFPALFLALQTLAGVSPEHRARCDSEHRILLDTMLKLNKLSKVAVSLPTPECLKPNSFRDKYGPHMSYMGVKRPHRGCLSRQKVDTKGPHSSPDT